MIRIEWSKNGERPYRTLPALGDLVERQRVRADAIQRAHGLIVTHVFTRADGRPVRDFRNAWARACQEAELPHRLAHDFRRTAAQNMSRAGVPERVITALCGWKTRSVFDRYRIVKEQDLADGLGKLASSVSEACAASPKVMPLRTGTAEGAVAPLLAAKSLKGWGPGTESNRRHADSTPVAASGMRAGALGRSGRPSR